MRSNRSAPQNVVLLFSKAILPQVVVLVTTMISHSQGLVVLPANVTVPAVFMFGDSIVDTGNNNHLLTVARSNFEPYGCDFMGGKATGRFSNGKIPADLIAEEFGIKDTLPAFLDPSLQPGELPTGVSFASSAAGLDPLTSKLFNVVSMSQQLQLFSKYKDQLTNLVGTSKADEIVADSLYIVVSGTNDLAEIYFHTPLRTKKYDTPSYIRFLITSASAFFQGLYKLGARRIGMLGLTPLGCLPAQRTLSGGLGRKLGTTLPQVRLAYMDGYGSLMDIIQAPHEYGFEIVDRGCCGTGLLETAILCNQWSPCTCTNSSRFVFWDSFHPTERTYRILLQKVMGKLVQDIFQ